MKNKGHLLPLLLLLKIFFAFAPSQAAVIYRNDEVYKYRSGGGQCVGRCNMRERGQTTPEKEPRAPELAQTVMATCVQKKIQLRPGPGNFMTPIFYF